MSTLAAAVLATTVRLVASHAYAEGAPPGFSGGFKEESCHACHFHAELNSSGGRVTIDGVPAKFAPGERYTLTITLTRSGMKRAGFQLAARFTDSGAQAGALAPGPGEEGRVGVESQGGVQYAGQKLAGSVVGAADAARWTIAWTAPDRGGPVIFHASANAADGNESADGDVVYTGTSDSLPAAFALHSGEGAGSRPIAPKTVCPTACAYHLAMPRRARRSVSLPRDLAQEIDRAATRSGTTFSGWLADTAAHRLRLEAGRRAIATWEREQGALTGDERAEGLARARSRLGRSPRQSSRRSSRG